MTGLNFKEILREKMTQNEDVSPSWSEFDAPKDPAHLAFLLGRIGKLHVSPAKSPYKTSPRKPHNFEPSQKESFEYLKLWVHDLSEGFTGRELKNAFRRAALKLHPDQGGNTEDFLCLKSHYMNLQTVFA